MAVTDFYSGAGLRLILDGAPIAYAKGFQVDVNVSHEAIEAFGSILDIEHVPNSVKVSGSIAMTLVKNNSPYAQGLTLRNKQALLSFEGQTIYVEDIRTGEQVAAVFGMRIESKSMRFAKGGVAMVDCTFVGIDATDEVNPDA